MITFRNLKILQSLFFLFIPLILIIVNGGVLDSISDYANHTPMTFALLLTLSGALFFYDGFVERKRLYNLYVGFSLFGVVLFINNEFPILHYIFASVFFLGSLFNMVFFSSNKQRLLKSFTALFVLLGMSGHFIFGYYSLFWAEWIGMFPISIHYILELLGKID